MEILEHSFLFPLKVLVVFDVVEKLVEFLYALKQRLEGTFSSCFFIPFSLCSAVEVTVLVLTIDQVDILFAENVILFLLFLNPPI